MSLTVTAFDIGSPTYRKKTIAEQQYHSSSVVLDRCTPDPPFAASQIHFPRLSCPRAACLALRPKILLGCDHAPSAASLCPEPWRSFYWHCDANGAVGTPTWYTWGSIEFNSLWLSAELPQSSSEFPAVCACRGYSRNPHPQPAAQGNGHPTPCPVCLGSFDLPRPEPVAAEGGAPRWDPRPMLTSRACGQRGRGNSNRVRAGGGA